MLKISRATKTAITAAILAGVDSGAHKGDLQDAVTAAIARLRGTVPGRTYLTIDEAAFATRALDALACAVPPGFKRDAVRS